jgi:hypothetical protein
VKLPILLASIVAAIGTATAAEWPADARPLIQQAGNVTDETERQAVLEKLVALPSLSEDERKEAAAMAEYVRKWNGTKLKFYGSQVKGKGPRALADYNFGVGADSPLRPIAELFRGRMLAWTLIENSTVRTSPTESRWFKDEAVKSFQATKEAFPENQVARMYLGERIPWPMTFSSAPGAPEWAVLQREQLERLRAIILWWVENRQQSNGAFGGGWGDDCEMWRWWSSVLLGFDDPKITEAQLKFSKSAMRQKHIKDGYNTEIGDVEHSAEDTTDNLVPLLLLEPENPRWVQAALHLGDFMRDVWTARNERGQLQFKSFYFGASGSATESRRAFDVIADVGALHPALVAWQRTADPKLGAQICAWLDTWVDATARAEGGKPAGILPAAIRWPDGAVAGAEGHWWEPIKPGAFMHSYYIWPSVLTEMTDALMLAHVMTGDEKYLAPLRSMAAIRLASLNVDVHSTPPPGSEGWCALQLAPRKNANSNVGGLVKSLARCKALTGTHEFDELLAREGGEFVVRTGPEGERDLVNALRESLAALRVNFAGFTSEVRSTDRCMRFVQFLSEDYAFDEYRGVTQPKHELLYRMATGDKNAPRFPQMAVRWRTPPVDIAALVSDANMHQLSAHLFHFGEKPRAMRADLMALAPGTYAVKLETPGGASALPALTVERGAIPTVKFELPAQKLCTLRITATP